MDNAVTKAGEEIKQPSVFFDTVHEVMRLRTGLSKDDLKQIQEAQTGNLRINQVAKVLEEHFDEIRDFSDRPKKLDSTFGEYHQELFEEKDKPADVLTKRQLSIFENMFDHSKEQSNLNWSTYGRIAKRSVQTLAAGVGTGLFGAAAIGDPELGTKVLCGFIAGNLYMSTYRYAGNLIEPAGTMLHGQYLNRQQVIDSWKFFDKKAAY